MAAHGKSSLEVSSLPQAGVLICISFPMRHCGFLDCCFVPMIHVSFFFNRKFYCLKNENVFGLIFLKKPKNMQKGHNFFKQLSFIKKQTKK